MGLEVWGLGFGDVTVVAVRLFTLDLTGFCTCLLRTRRLYSVAMSLCVWDMRVRSRIVCVERQDSLRYTRSRRKWSVAAPSDIGLEDGCQVEFR